MLMCSPSLYSLARPCTSSLYILRFVLLPHHPVSIHMMYSSIDPHTDPQ